MSAQVFGNTSIQAFNGGAKSLRGGLESRECYEKLAVRVTLLQVDN
jgi:hypothetical protein